MCSICRNAILSLTRLLTISLTLILLPSSHSLAQGKETSQDKSLERLLAMSLEELIEVEVSVATGTPKPLKLAPSVATVITAADIERMGAATLDEVLESVPGLHVEPSGFTYLSSIWSIRGIHNGFNPHVLLLLNGIPFKDPENGSKPLTYKIASSMISKVEIIRGPGSAVHGADAFSGVVNVITKDGKEINGTKATGRIGSFDTYMASLQHGKDYGGWDIATGIDFQKSQGDDNRIIDSDRLGSGPPSLTPTSIDTQYELLDAHFSLKKSGFIFRLYGSLQEATMGPIIQAITNDSEMDKRYFLTDLSYNTKDLITDWDFGLRFWYEYLFKNADAQLFPPSFRNWRGNPIQESNIGGIDTSAQYTGIKQHQIRMGAGIHFIDNDTDQWKNWGPGISNPGGEMVNIKNTPYVFRDDHHRRLWYVLAQDGWSFAKDWELTLGVRYDEYNDFGDTTNPRAALVWQARQNLVTKFLYGRAFRPPGFGEQYNKSNALALGNPNLDPETIETLELAFDYQPMSNLQTKLNLFYYEIDGLIAYEADPAPATSKTAQNTRDQEGQGFELEVNWIISDTWRLKADYAYQRSKDSDTGALVADAPQQQLHINPIWTFLPDWTLDTQLYWIADRPRASGDPREDIDDYALVHLTLHRKNILKNWKLAVGIRNLFDEDARIPSDGKIPNDYPMEGRSFWAELSFHF